MTQITRANVHHYNQIMQELFSAIHNYRSEYKSHVMKQTSREKIFKCYEQLESMGK